MNESQAAELLSELQEAFRRALPEDSIPAYQRALMSHDHERAEAGIRSLIDSEERFPPIAVLHRYIGREPSDAAGLSEADRRKGKILLADDCRQMAKLRKEPFESVLRGHLAMCEENQFLDDEFDQTWHERASWCRELLHRETGNVA